MEYFEDEMQSIRMTCYPPCPQPELVMSFTPHSGSIFLTILLQFNSVDGLHIRKDGVWFLVSILPNALLVNVGNILEIDVFIFVVFLVDFVEPLLKCAGNDDTISIKVDDGSDTVTFIFESP
ncbi:hypothetical protein Golob_009914, partial [Gossypium lobatum]|nr:hypothetical protein [Gossypium lobatum]